MTAPSGPTAPLPGLVCHPRPGRSNAVEQPVRVLAGPVRLDGDLARPAARASRGKARLEVVPGASHLFEEPGPGVGGRVGRELVHSLAGHLTAGFPPLIGW
jgi:hypothetical protein